MCFGTGNAERKRSMIIEFRGQRPCPAIHIVSGSIDTLQSVIPNFRVVQQPSLETIKERFITVN